MNNKNFFTHNLLFGAFGGLIILISATTTFSFFYTYFDNITIFLPQGISSFLSGFIGTVLFDFASIFYLNAFLKTAETREQRGIALLMVVVTYLGSISASIAYFVLQANGLTEVPQDFRQLVGGSALITVCVGIALNVGAWITYTRYSLASKQAVRESDRRDAIQEEEDEQLKLLDQSVREKVKVKLQEASLELSEKQSNKIVEKYTNREGAKYGTASVSPQNEPKIDENKPTVSKPNGGKKVDSTAK